MKTCSFCGAENEDAAAFCEECGKSFYKKCDKCGAENKLTAKFCNKCGARFVAPNTICYTATKKIESTWVCENSSSHDFEDGNGYIVLKDGVNSIDGEIFKDSKGFSSLTIPNSVTEITIPYWTTDEYKELLPSNVWDKLKEVLEPHTIYYEADKKIEFKKWNCCEEDWDDNDWIFEHSISHEFANGKGKIRLKNDITAIGHEAFINCSELTGTLIIPKSITSIGISAFSDCSELTSVTIPNSVTSIGSSAFYNCSGLTSINIPKSVTKIGDRAFKGCKALSSIIVPNSVTEIWNEVFYNCRGLTSIAIPNSVTRIGISAFEGCDSLTSINIPDSVTEIVRGAFLGCTALTSIVVDQGNGKYDSRDNCNAIIETATNILVVGCMNTIIPDSVTKIDYKVFYNCRGLTSITIPNSVTCIVAGAFEGCDGLTSINIPDSLTRIGNAFCGCDSLPEETKEKILKLNKYAFDSYLPF